MDWNAGGMGGKLLTVQGEDGNVVLYADEGRTAWATDKLTGGRMVIPLRPDLRAHPSRPVPVEAPPSPVSGHSRATEIIDAARSARPDHQHRLEDQIMEGNVLRARIAGSGERFPLLPAALREGVAAWEAKTTTVLARKPAWLRDFDIPAPADPFAVTAGAAHKRISEQLTVLQAAIRAW